MLARLQKAQKNDDGFTLIELLVVIVIIGILAGIAIPLFLNQRQKSVDAGIKSDLKNAATAIESYAVDNPTTAIPDSSAGPTSAAGTGALTTFRATTGNTITVKKGTALGSYCISGWNAGASEAKDASKQIVYNSEAGGLQTGTGTCA